MQSAYIRAMTLPVTGRNKLGYIEIFNRVWESYIQQYSEPLYLTEYFRFPGNKVI